ncbi:MAG: hypothetical protein VX589_10450 [Myxococcota bacterium]|nr:hypothetical protein [Myxococcota bacterium]
MNQPSVRRFIIPLSLIIVIACGDTLVDQAYRGEILWSLKGSIQPAPEINAAELTCRFQEVECLEEFSENIAGFLGDPINDDDFEVCTDGCYDGFDACQTANSMENFSDVYFGSNEVQRLAIIWANPNRLENPASNSGRVIQQRSIVSTGFPARYTVSIYQPPPAAAFFERDGNDFAYGIVVTFYDRNQNEVFDIQTEPIIGFNQVSGVLYARQSIRIDDESRISAGYHLYGLHDCSATQFLATEPLSEDPDSTTLSISGTTTALFDILPDISCDGDQREWLDLCQAPMYGGRCRSTTPPEPFANLCNFCLGQSMIVNPIAGEGPIEDQIDEFEETENDDEDEQEPSDASDDADEEDCMFSGPDADGRCQVESAYEDCLSEASSDPDLESQCELDYEEALCLFEAQSEAERSLCAEGDSNELPAPPTEDDDGDDDDADEADEDE